MAYPTSTRTRSSPQSKRGSSRSGPATSRSRPRSSLGPGVGGRQRVRLLRRAAVRQRPARTTATCSPGTSRTWCRATRRCAATGWSAASAGTATVCRPRWRRRRSSACRPSRRSSIRRRPRSTRPAARRCCATPEWERYVTRQARWVDFANDYKTLDLSYMESVMWAFKIAVRQGPDLRGLPRAVVLLALRDAAVEHRDPDGRRLPGPPGPGAHGVVRLTASRAHYWRGRPRRGRCRRTSRWRSVRPSSTRCRARWRQPVQLGTARWVTTRRSSVGFRRWARSPEPTGRASLHPAVRVFRRAAPDAFQVLAADFVSTEDGTGVVHIAPGVWRGRLTGWARPRDCRWCARWM